MPEKGSSRSDKKEPVREVEGFEDSDVEGNTPNSEVVKIGETPSNIAVVDSRGRLQTGFSSMALGF